MINSYNFVRSDRSMERKEPITHERMSGYNGLITCQLETRTPIFTPASAQRAAGRAAELRFFRISNRPALPGSSLKGMFRSLAEAIANGCSPFDSYQHPRCRSLDSLCPVCRLFGYLKGNEVHAGQLCISDAIAEDGWEFGPRITLKELSSPKSSHYAFYEQAGQERGRKFYYHQQHIRQADDIPTEIHPTHRNVRIEPLLKGAFRFTTRYWNAGEVELGLLLHTIELPEEPERLYHKFGMAKPLGLGTVYIRIVGWREYATEPENPASRYRQFDVESLNLSIEGLEGDALAKTQQQLRQRIDFFKSAYARKYADILGQPPTDNLWSLEAKNLQDLRIMLSAVSYSKEIHYPDYGWFRQHGQVRLPSTYEVHHRGKRLPD